MTIGTAELGILLILAIPALIIICIVHATASARRASTALDRLADQACTPEPEAAAKRAAAPATADARAGVADGAPSQDTTPARRAAETDLPATALMPHHITSTPWRA